MTAVEVQPLLSGPALAVAIVVAMLVAFAVAAIHRAAEAEDADR